MHTPIKNIDRNVIKYLNDSCVIFDVETTGLSPKDDRVIEFAAAKLVEGQIVDTISFLINPQKQIHSRISAINNITNDMVKDKPTEDYYIDNIIEFFKGSSLICGHNVSFDLSFLDAILGRKGVTFSCYYLDTLQLARKYIPGLSSYKLTSLAEYLGLKVEGAHRALYDVSLTTELLKHIAKIALSN